MTTLLLTGVGGAGSFSPISMTGLQLWMKAYSGLFQDTAGTIPCTTNGQNCEYITDYSGNSNPAVFNATGNPWLYDTNVQNSLPAVVDGSGPTGQFSLNSTMAFTGPLTYYGVFKRANGGQSSFGGSPDSALDGWMVFIDQNIYLGAGSGNRVSHAYGGSAGWGLIRIRRDASNVYYYQATGSGGEVSVGTAAGTLHINKIFNCGGQIGIGQIGEWIITNIDTKTSQAAQDTAVISYMRSAWNVTFP